MSPRRGAATRGVSLPDEVLPVALTEPARQRVRDRRWARLTAQGSLMMVGFLGVLTHIFSGTKPEVVAEQQAQQTGDAGALQPDETAGAPRFAGTIRVTLDAPPRS